MNKERVIEKMELLVAQAKALPRSDTNGIEFKRWESAVKAFLKRLGGDYLKEFEEIRFIPGSFTLDSGKELFIDSCMRGVEEAVAYLNSQIEDIGEWGLSSTDAITSIKNDNGMQINITQSQSQTQAMDFGRVDLSKYDGETQSKAKELFNELEKPHKDKLKISGIIKYLADKAVDILIAIMVSKSGLA